MFSQLKDILWSLLLALGLAFFLRSFVFAVYKIPSSSMQPNLLAGDFIISYKLPYGFRFDSIMDTRWGVWSEPKRGEIFVFHLPSNSKVKYIKRVIGVAGDKIEIKEDLLYINDQVASYKELGSYKESSYLLGYKESILNFSQDILIMEKQEKSNFGPMVVPPKSVFVLGDNRDSSDDSRYWGVVSLNEVESKVFGIWFSMDIKSGVEESTWQNIRWERILQVVE